MLAKRIIPCLDVKGGRVVKGTNFVNLVDAGDPVEVARFYQDKGADELVFLDITASHEGRKAFYDVIERTSEQCFMPLTVGGGLSHIDDIAMALRSGADKVSLNTAAVYDVDLIRRSADRFGSQCIVIAIDVRYDQEKWWVYTHGGRRKTDKDIVSWVQEVEQCGAGELLVTSMDCDGVKEGYDLDLYRSICEVSRLPLIASGGAGKVEDFLNVLRLPGVDAALAASVFHYKEIDLITLHQYLKKEGVCVRCL